MPTIDHVTFEQLKINMGEDFIGELVEAYCTETPDLIARLGQAFEQGDVEAFRRNAHSIKSSSASMGALDFSAQARELEMISKGGDLSAAPDGLANLTKSYPDVAQALRQLAGLEGDGS